MCVLDRKGGYYNSSLYLQHGVAILEDLLITLADGIASMYLELISVDSSFSNEINHLGLSLCTLSTRALQRLRNEVWFHLFCLLHVTYDGQNFLNFSPWIIRMYKWLELILYKCLMEYGLYSFSMHVCEGSLVCRLHSTSGCIKTWQQWYQCMTMNLISAHLKANSLKCPTLVWSMTLSGGRGLLSINQHPSWHHCNLSRSTTYLYQLKGQKN